MKGMKKIYYLFIILAILANTLIVYADNNVDNYKKSLEQTKRQINSLKNQKSTKQKEYKDVQSEIKRLDNQLDAIDKEIQTLESQLNQLNMNIDETEKQLKEAKNNIKEKNDIINKRLRVMYKNGTVDYVEVLLDANDINDFLTRIDMVQEIIEHDVELLKYMKEQRDIIAEKKSYLENQKEMMLSTKANIEQKKHELVVVTRAKETFMRSLEKDIKELEKQEDELLALANKIEEQIRLSSIKEQYAGGKMMWPAPGYTRITSPFGYRIHPIFKTRKMHTGIDIGVPLGGTIVAVNDGVVQYSGWLGGYGKVIILDHGGGISTLYAHNSRLLVSKGQKVKKGQAIAKAGSTGNSTGPHLHFEVRERGKYVNPRNYVNPF